MLLYAILSYVWVSIGLTMVLSLFLHKREINKKYLTILAFAFPMTLLVHLNRYLDNLKMEATPYMKRSKQNQRKSSTRLIDMFAIRLINVLDRLRGSYDVQ